MEEIYWLCLFLAPYECITLPLYIRIIFVLIRQKPFQQPFYRLISIIGIVDLVHFSTEFCFYRLGYFQFFIQLFLSFQNARWISWLTISIFGCTYVQLLLHLAISLNRFTALYYPFVYKKYWKLLWHWLVLFVFLLSLALCSDRMMGVGKFAPMLLDDPGKGVIPSVVEYSFLQFDQSLFTVVLGSFCCISCLAINLINLFLIWREKKANKLPGIEEKNIKIELNLFLVTLFMMAPQTVLICFHIILRLFLNNQLFGLFLSSGNNKTQVLYQMMQQNAWLDDLFSLTQPWILLIVCSEVRKAVLGPIFPKYFNENKQNELFIKVSSIQNGKTISNKTITKF